MVMMLVCIGAADAKGAQARALAMGSLGQTMWGHTVQDEYGRAHRDDRASLIHLVAAAGSGSHSQTTGVALAASHPAGDEPDDQTFAIRDFFVQGNNLLLPDQVEALLAPFTGPARGFKDIEGARAALEKAYRDLGYPTVAVTVPEQTIEYGIVTLTVYEGRLKSVTVTDNLFFSSGYIRDKLRALRAGALLHEPTVLKQLDALNTNPDVKVTPVLKSSDDPGLLKLELKTKDRPPVHGRVELNNRGVPTTPRLRLNAALQYTNLFDADHVLTLQTSQTPQDWGAVEVYSGNYVVPLGDPGHQLVFYGATARSRARLNQSPLPAGGGFEIIGNSVVSGFRYTVPFGAVGDMQHQVSVGIDYKHLGRSQAAIPGGGGSITVSNPVTYTPAFLGYLGVHQNGGGITKVTGTARGYIAGLVPQGDTADFQGDQNDALNKPGLRRFASASFAVLQGGVDRYQPLPYEFSLAARIDGQWTTGPVLPTEEYFAGGMDSVRGYREFEAVGDHAAHGTVEVLTPAVKKWPLEHIERSLRFAAFYDTAYLWIQKPLPSQLNHWYLQGTGVGLRFTLSQYLRFRYDAAWTLNHGPFSPADSFYGHFSLEAVF